MMTCETCYRVYVKSEGPDQPVHPLTESFDTKECINGERRSR